MTNRGRPPIDRVKAEKLIREGLALNLVAERLGCAPATLTSIARAVRLADRAAKQGEKRA
jgi:hypothetical protein